MEADLSHFLIAETAAVNVQLIDLLLLQSFADDGPADGSVLVIMAQIDLIHVHLAQADLSHFRIGEAAGGKVQLVKPSCESDRAYRGAQVGCDPW